MTAPAAPDAGAGARWRHHAAVLLAVTAYGAVAAVADPMTWPVRIAVAAPVIVVVVALARGRHQPHRPWPRPDLLRAGPAPLVVWTLLIVAVAAFNLGHFFAEPRSVYPTLSSLFEEPLSLYPVRAAAFAVWARLGWFLVAR